MTTDLPKSRVHLIALALMVGHVEAGAYNVSNPPARWRACSAEERARFLARARRLIKQSEVSR